MTACRGESVAGRLDREAVLGVFDAGHFGAHERRAQTFSLLLAALEQFCAGKRFGEAEIILDLVGLAERAAVLVQHGGLHPGADRVNGGRQPGRAAADDDDVGHCFNPFLNR